MIVLISIFDTIVNLYKPRIPGQLYQICIKITIFNISRRDKNKERAKSQRLSSFFVLPWKDSNLTGGTRIRRATITPQGNFFVCHRVLF